MWGTDQSDEDAEELDDVGVGDAVEPAEQSIEDGDARAEHDRRTMVHVNDHAQCCTWNVTQSMIQSSLQC